MLVLYQLGIRLYFLLLYLASLFNEKAKDWINGRKKQSFIRLDGCVWFHFASLGEFEQGRPVLEKIRLLHPEKKIVITFFSPSGYNVRKNTPLADAVYYLPLDTATNAREFIAAVKPEIAVFTKYEYWYNFFNELHRRDIPLYIISGIFRDNQVFFKWYGGLNRKILSFVTHFFLQDEHSRSLLATIGINNASVTGDTRFDRVWENAQQPKELPIIAEFTAGHKTFIGGSTWPDDEKLLITLIGIYPDWKFIFAPHEIQRERVNRLMNLLPEGSAIKHSEIADGNKEVSDFQTLVIDNIGMLSSLYQYGQIAYIGGGFGVGIHNTLEAAAFGLPVIFGPNYTRFKEARELVELQAGFSICNEADLKDVMNRLANYDDLYKQSSDKARGYVDEQKGATEAIITQII